MHRDFRRSSFRRSGADMGEDVNPSAYIVNMVDCMLVLACGFLVMLMLHWNTATTTVATMNAARMLTRIVIKRFVLTLSPYDTGPADQPASCLAADSAAGSSRSAMRSAAGMSIRSASSAASSLTDGFDAEPFPKRQVRLSSFVMTSISARPLGSPSRKRT